MRIRAAVVLIGFTASVAQIVLMRELMVVFAGNEISLGLMLASWLLWTAAGSAVAGRIRADPRRLMAGLEALAAIALPLTILAVRSGKTALGAVPGESLSPGAMLLGSLAALSVFCFFSGALFATGGRLLGGTTAQATGSVYLLEAIGSAVGGVLAGLVLVNRLSPLEIAGGLGALNLLAAAGLVRRWAAVVALSAAALAEIPFAFPRLESGSIESFWRGFHVVATRNSAYGNLAVVGTEGTRSLYENGLLLFTAPDPAAAEESVHYALLEHPAPRSLLLIGGGMNGSLVEAWRHARLKRIDYVELDPAILDLAKRFFPKQLSFVSFRTSVRTHVTDGRWFVKTTTASFDVIVVNLPDPQTAQLNRFYTEEFFREAAARLAPGGVFSFRLTSSENYISPELAEFLRSIHKTLRAVFSEVAAIPGETVHFFAANRAGVLAAGPDELLARLRERRLETTYVREYYIPYRMSPDRMRELAAQIEPLPQTPVNRDFAPVAYYFNVALWNSRFSAGYRAGFRAMARVRFGSLAAGAAVLLLAAMAAVRLRRRRLPAVAAFCTASMGFTMIGIEILILLAFQAVYGSVYQNLAMLIAAFMAGMALGTWLGRRGKLGIRALATLQILAAAAPLLLCVLFETFPVGRILFPVLALLCGMLGGCEFPVASRIFFSTAKRCNPGALYAWDLAGSCVGAVLFSAYLIPVFGFVRTAVLAGMVGVAPAVLAITHTAEREAD